MKNWYLICTKANKENKVASSLRKKGLEIFSPTTSANTKVSASKNITERKPLFTSYIFANITEQEIKVVTKTDYVINVAYYHSKPAIVNEAEISAIKMMVEGYNTITVDTIKVNVNALVAIKPNTFTVVGHNSITIQQKGIAVNLPSIGFRLSASTEITSIIPLQPKISVAKKIVSSVFSY